MYEFLNQTYNRLLDQTKTDFKRYLYKDFKLARLVGLVGPRGVGKTTLMLQYIKENLANKQNAFYFSADSVYFQQSSLLSFINDLYNLEGHRYFFIDEVHKYNNWEQELKNLYDAFPDIRIIYSGSSTLEITKGSYDLSRRTKLFNLKGMSFREYLNYQETANLTKIDYSTLLSNPKSYHEISAHPKILGRFKEYLSYGYYPFYFEDSHNYLERVIRIIEKIIYEDIPSFYDLKTHNLHLFHKILSYLAAIPPGEVNTNNIAKNMNVAHQTIVHYLNILESVGLITKIYPAVGGNQGLRKPQKIFLHNTTLLFALQSIASQVIDLGNLRELYFTQALRDANKQVHYSKIGDFSCEENIFEVGGKNKTRKQLKNATNSAYLVKDDILNASQQTIPLLFLGFLY